MSESSDPPWKGEPEADYMPRLRRHFADSIPGRLAVADGALGRLSDPAYRAVPGDVPAARAIHLFGHSLAGTGPSLGATRLGDLGHELSELTRPWEHSGPPDPADLLRARELVEQIRKSAAQYVGWVEASPAE